MILVLDNYDSFTFNLVQMLAAEAGPVLVRRNDEIGVADIGRIRPAGILLSPGPGRPERAGIMMEVIAGFGATIPMLGVCLGHQAIGCSFGARLVHAPVPVHGKVSRIMHGGSGLFDGVPVPLHATRYHSLALDEATMPAELEITARSDDGVVMGLQHRTLPLAGVQFHPESALSEHGVSIIRNWLAMIR